MHPAVRNDRIWFQNNPEAVVRFRRAFRAEFQSIVRHGKETPVFRPSFCRSEAPTSWVAVVDLIRLIQPGEVEPSELTARVRLRIPALRSIVRKRRAERELTQAIAVELLSTLEEETNSDAA